MALIPIPSASLDWFATAMGEHMSVYVRLSDTVEDTLAAFTGCVNCAHPLPANGAGGLKCYIRACPSCGRRDRTDLYDD